MVLKILEIKKLKNRKPIIILSVFFIFLLPLIAFSQTKNYRIKANFSIKQKDEFGKFSLIKGVVSYDYNTDKLSYNYSFPYIGKAIYTKDKMYIINDTAKQFYANVMSNKLSVYYMALDNSLDNFGLNNSLFKIIKTEKANGLIITTWESPTVKGAKKTKILTSKRNNLLYGVVFMNDKNEVVSKEFYKNYILIKGCSFPQEIIRIIIKEKKEIYQSTTFKNVIINEIGNDNIYNPTTNF